MKCEDCIHAKRISMNIVHCIHFGINVKRDYTGCISKAREEKGGKHNEQTDNHRQPDA